jgi:glutamyl-tRNA(Gln) amidotransferase subunit E
MSNPIYQSYHEEKKGRIIENWVKWDLASQLVRQDKVDHLKKSWLNVKLNQPQWLRLLAYTLKELRREGLEVGSFN